jgi:hypothetical protein
MTFKSRIKSLLLGAPGPRPQRISRGVLRGAMFTVDTSSKSMRLLGLDEAEIAGWLRRLAARAAVAVDVGANDGWYAVYFALQPNIARVFAFEPDDRLHETFRQNLALNGRLWSASAYCRRSAPARSTTPRQPGSTRRLNMRIDRS